MESPNCGACWKLAEKHISGVQTIRRLVGEDRGRGRSLLTFEKYCATCVAEQVEQRPRPILVDPGDRVPKRRLPHAQLIPMRDTRGWSITEVFIAKPIAIADFMSVSKGVIGVAPKVVC